MDQDPITPAPGAIAPGNIYNNISNISLIK